MKKTLRIVISLILLATWTFSAYAKTIMRRYGVCRTR